MQSKMYQSSDLRRHRQHPNSTHYKNPHIRVCVHEVKIKAAEPKKLKTSQKIKGCNRNRRIIILSYVSYNLVPRLRGSGDAELEIGSVFPIFCIESSRMFGDSANGPFDEQIRTICKLFSPSAHFTSELSSLRPKTD